jgi:hypothetical protein
MSNEELFRQFLASSGKAGAEAAQASADEVFAPATRMDTPNPDRQARMGAPSPRNTPVSMSPDEAAEIYVAAIRALNASGTPKDLPSEKEGGAYAKVLRGESDDPSTAYVRTDVIRDDPTIRRTDREYLEAVRRRDNFEQAVRKRDAAVRAYENDLQFGPLQPLPGETLEDADIRRRIARADANMEREKRGLRPLPTVSVDAPESPLFFPAKVVVKQAANYKDEPMVVQYTKGPPAPEPPYDPNLLTFEEAQETYFPKVKAKEANRLYSTYLELMGLKKELSDTVTMASGSRTTAQTSMSNKPLLEAQLAGLKGNSFDDKIAEKTVRIPIREGDVVTLATESYYLPGASQKEIEAARAKSDVAVQMLAVADRVSKLSALERTALLRSTRDEERAFVEGWIEPLLSALSVAQQQGAVTEGERKKWEKLISVDNLLGNEATAATMRGMASSLVRSLELLRDQAQRTGTQSQNQKADGSRLWTPFASSTRTRGRLPK